MMWHIKEPTLYSSPSQFSIKGEIDLQTNAPQRYFVFEVLLDLDSFFQHKYFPKLLHYGLEQLCNIK